MGLAADSTDVNTSWNVGQCDVKAWQLMVNIDKGITAAPTNSGIVVNDKKYNIGGYIIKKNLYVKIGDLAFVLRGTNKQFLVEGDGIKTPIKLTSKSDYKPNGGELKDSDGEPKSAIKTISEIDDNGKKVKFSTYKINEDTYFMLHDMMQKFNVYEKWDCAANTITIDTKKGYQ